MWEEPRCLSSKISLDIFSEIHKNALIRDLSFPNNSEHTQAHLQVRRPEN